MGVWVCSPTKKKPKVEQETAQPTAARFRNTAYYCAPNKSSLVYWTTLGTSLNDQLLQGPDLTNTIVGVLTRFRQEQITFMSDIEAMFYQVRVCPGDCDYLRFLWWPDSNLNKDPEEYQMLVPLFQR